MKYLIKVILSLFLVCSTKTGYAQVTFQSFYDPYYYDVDYVQHIEQTVNGDYVIGVSCVSMITTNAIQIMRLNAVGDTIGMCAFGSSTTYDYFEDIALTDDEGCGFIGTSIYPGPVGHDKDIVIGKVDSVGAMMWNFTLDVGGNDWASSITSTSDGGFIASGITDYNSPFIVKMNSAGSVEWLHKLNDSLIWYQNGGNVIECNNGDFASIYSTTKDSQTTVTVVCRFDPSGNIIWHKEYQNGDYLQGASLDEMSNGDLVFVARDDYSFWTTICYSVTRIDVQGTVVWSKLAAVSTNYNYTPTTICVTPFDEILVCGRYNYQNYYNWTGYVSKFGSNGAHIFSMIYDNDQNNLFQDIISTSDGGFAAIGQIDTFSRYTYLVKGDAQGNAGCESSFYLPYVSFQQVSSVDVTTSVDTGYTLSAGTLFSTFEYRRRMELCPVGVPENTIDHSSVYYNNLNSTLVIDHVIPGNMLLIYDISGRIIKREEIGSHFYEVNCADLACGVYVYSILAQGSQQTSGKFVKE